MRCPYKILISSPSFIWSATIFVFYIKKNYNAVIRLSSKKKLPLYFLTLSYIFPVLSYIYLYLYITHIYIPYIHTHTNINFEGLFIVIYYHTEKVKFNSTFSKRSPPSPASNQLTHFSPMFHFRGYRNRTLG